jgi:hypothetical protein
MWSERFVRGMVSGDLVRYGFKLGARLRLFPTGTCYRLGLTERPQVAYGLMTAAVEASKLGLSEMTAIEFGVGAGHGLLAMEDHAQVVGQLTGVSIAVVGFDTGSGLPEPVDYRDLPYVWEAGFYKMDVKLLTSRPRSAELVLGDVRDTVLKFMARPELRDRPVGFVVFDLDYWSSTSSAFQVFRRDAACCLPRVLCYFDDIPWTIEDVGELRAIRDFNAEDRPRKIRHQFSLRARLPFEPRWADQIYQAHVFDHKSYGVLLADREAEKVSLGRRSQ